jgi:hypothetical protein
LKRVTIAFVALAISFYCLPAEAAAKTYPPNSKSNPLAPAFANISYAFAGLSALRFEPWKKLVR